MKLRKYSTDILARKTGAFLNNKIRRYGKKSFLLMLSGGSALKIVDFLNIKLFNKKTTICVLDERHSNIAQQNNFYLLKQTAFYRQVQKRGTLFINSQTQKKESLEKHCQRFERQIIKWLIKNRRSPIFATLGVGPDGHIAGIMPLPEFESLFNTLFDSDKIITAYNAREKNEIPNRITVTFPFLRHFVTSAVCYISGLNKKPALNQILTADEWLAKTPALIMHQMKDVTVFTDIDT